MSSLIQANACRIPLSDESVQMVVTSPPYWGLRKYSGEQESVWDGRKDCEHEWIISERAGISGIKSAKVQVKGEANFQIVTSSKNSTCFLCGAWRGAFGLEPTVEMYVQHTIEILREIRRVLRKDGVVFWNIGDSYAAGCVSGKQGKTSTSGINKGQGEATKLPPRKPTDNLKPKDLCLIPDRVRLAVQADGWWVRSNIIWVKPNPMPESIIDRPTDSYEDILMLTKSARYFWDKDAVAELSITRDTRKPYAPGQVDVRGDGHDRGGGSETERNGSTRNLRNVWLFPTQPYRGAHFAVFPEELPRRCIKAATSEYGACEKCGAPWERIVSKKRVLRGDNFGKRDVEGTFDRGQQGTAYLQIMNTQTIGWQPTCECNETKVRPCVVLDPFGGSGTTGRVATELGRRAILLDIAYTSGAYLELAQKRNEDVQTTLSLEDL